MSSVRCGAHLYFSSEYVIMLILLYCVWKNCTVTELIWFDPFHKRSTGNTSEIFSVKNSVWKASEGEKSVGRNFCSANILFGENYLRKNLIRQKIWRRKFIQQKFQATPRDHVWAVLGKLPPGRLPPWKLPPEKNSSLGKFSIVKLFS